MISDAQITMLRLLSKDVAIAIDRAVKAKMQEQRISQGQLLLQTTRLLCSLQSQEQVVEAACQCACQLLHADNAAFVDCSSLDKELYNPVEIGDPRERGQLFEAIVWQKTKNDDDGTAAAADIKSSDDDANERSATSSHTDDDESEHDDGMVEDSTASRSAAAAAFIRSIFNRAPPSPASLRDAWCVFGVTPALRFFITHRTSHITRHSSTASHCPLHTPYQDGVSCSSHRWRQQARCRCRSIMVKEPRDYQTASKAVSVSRALAGTGIYTPSTQNNHVIIIVP